MKATHLVFLCVLLFSTTVSFAQNNPLSFDDCLIYGQQQGQVLSYHLGRDNSASNPSGFLYDSGGPTGRYGDGEDLRFNISYQPGEFSLGILITINFLNIGPSDNLSISGDGVVRENLASGDRILISNASSATIRFTGNTPLPHIYDGFEIRWDKVYCDETNNANQDTVGFFFDKKTLSLGGGAQINDNWQSRNLGDFSINFGYNSKSRGGRSVSLGYAANASRFSAIAIGLNTQASGLHSLALGSFANASGLYAISLGRNTTSSEIYSSALGHNAEATGAFSTALGSSANANGLFSSALGWGATANEEAALAMGRNAQADGEHSLSFGTDAIAGESGSISLGWYARAPKRFTTALGSTARAGSALQGFEGEGATAVGYGASAVSGLTTALGYDTYASNLYSLSAGAYARAEGISSIAIGPFAIASGYIPNPSVLNGHYSTAIGTHALITGFSSVALGSYARVEGDYSMAFGHGVSVPDPNTIRMGDRFTTSIGGFVDWSNISDIRFKKDIDEKVPGLDFIKRLRPVSYKLDVDALISVNHVPDSLRTTLSKQLAKDMVRTGFIAQEVEQLAIELGYDFSGVDKPQSSKGMYGLRYANFVVPIVKAVQEQDQKIEQLASENRALKNDLKRLIEEMVKLKEMYTQLDVNNHTDSTGSP